MPIHFACPRCAKPLSIATRKAGATVTCPACNQKVIVPELADDPLPGIPIQPPPNLEPSAQTTEPDAPTPIEPSAPAPAPVRRRVQRDGYDDEPILRRRRKKGPGAGVLVVFGLLGVVALVMVVAAVIRHDKGGQNSAKSGKQVTPSKSSSAQPRPRVERDADERPSQRDRDDGALAGLSMMAVIGIVIVIYLLLSLLIAIWVIQDARNRSVENGVMWMLLIFPFNFIALLIYLASRPHGSLIGCEKCGNRRLAFVGVCPHCRQPVRARGRVG